jgi:hypothetical protein
MFNLTNTFDAFGPLADFFEIIAYLFFMVIIKCIICFLIKAWTVHKLAKNSNQQYCWWAFFPVLQNAKIYRLAGFTEKLFFVILLIAIIVPIIPVPYLVEIFGILSIIWNYYIRWRVARNFGGQILMGILNIFFEPFVLIYLALTNKPFNPQPLPREIASFLDDMGLTDDENFK